VSPWGHPWGLSHNFRDWLDGILRLAKIPKRDEHGCVLNVHALRHSFATRRARAGVPLQQAAYLTGHRTLSVLMQIYTHLQGEDTRAAIAKLSLG
jgi:integrase